MKSLIISFLILAIALSSFEARKAKHSKSLKNSQKFLQTESVCDSPVYLFNVATGAYISVSSAGSLSVTEKASATKLCWAEILSGQNNLALFDSASTKILNLQGSALSFGTPQNGASVSFGIEQRDFNRFVLRAGDNTLQVTQWSIWYGPTPDVVINMETNNAKEWWISEDAPTGY